MTKVNIRGSIEVIIDEINVSDCEYEIHYRYRRDCGEWHSDMYGSDFEGHTKAQWLRILKNDEAFRLVMEEVVSTHL